MNWEVWSSGSETWEPCHMHGYVPPFLYIKHVRGRPYIICQNKLGQYFRCEVPDEATDDSDG